ncbi:MAG: Nif11-like leader peptide family natural product precursor [Synergistaceae bacterium]|jgi:predicted ribosomally synthesized peptide with nif11-like leader|nr:Nif11-like leader peptide family natural product precursor [Synergistaceae bacterium]
MSVEMAKDFVCRAGNDKIFLRRLEDVNSMDELLSVARVYGYDFTVKELEQVAIRMMNLQDEELEEIVGGASREPLCGGVLKIINLFRISGMRYSGK